jgi:hypothetical protein
MAVLKKRTPVMYSISDKFILVTTLFLVVVITGCAGRNLNQEQEVVSTEKNMSCSEIRDEKAYVDKQITTLNPDAKKTGEIG